MRKSLLCLAAALLLGSALGISAFDFGGTIDNSTTLTYAPNQIFLQEDKLALWLEIPLGSALTVSAQGSYTYSIERPYLFDVDILKLEGKFNLSGKRPALFSFTAGRFPFTDFSRLILDDTMVGLQLTLDGSRMNVTLAAAYNWLELTPVSTISMSWADINDTSLWAPPRLVEMATLRFSELFWRQDLLVSLLAQQDLRSQKGLLQQGDTVKVDRQGGRLSTEYLGLSLRGPLGALLYYEAFGFLGTGRTLSYIDGRYSYEWLVSALAGGALRFFRPQWLDSRAELRLLFASGDADYDDFFVEGNRDGLATTFVTISQTELALLFSPRLGNLVLLAASYSLKPVGILQTEVSGTLFLRPTSGPISDSRVDPASNLAYIGTEIDATVRLRPWSDLGSALSLGLFLPGAAFRTENRDLQFRGRFEISLSF